MSDKYSLANAVCFVIFAFLAGTRPPALFQHCRSLSGHTVIYNSTFYADTYCISVMDTISLLHNYYINSVVVSRVESTYYHNINACQVCCR